MRCPKCSTENPSGRSVCLRCGTRLRLPRGAAASALTTPEAGAKLMQWLRGDLLRLLLVAAAVVAAAVTMGLLLQ